MHPSFNFGQGTARSIPPDLQIQLYRLKETADYQSDTAIQILMEGLRSGYLTEEALLEELGRDLTIDHLAALFSRTTGLEDLHLLKLPNRIECNFTQALDNAIALDLKSTKEVLWVILGRSRYHYFGILLASTCLRGNKKAVQYIVSEGTKSTSVLQRSVWEQLRSVLSWLAERDYCDATEHLFRLYIQALCSHDQVGWEQQLPFLDPKANTFMAAQCIKLMSVLKRNICGLELDYSPSLDDAAAEQLSNYLPAELRYACIHWIPHLCTSDTPLIDEGPVHKFLRTHFFHWLEVMSLLRRIDYCEGLIRRLQRSFHVSEANYYIIVRY